MNNGKTRMYQYTVVVEVFVDGKGTREGGAAGFMSVVAASGIAAAMSADAMVLAAEILDARCRSDSADSSSSRSSSSPNGFRRTS